jgi:hypothetical protein
MYYTEKQEDWDEAKCRKMSRRVARDGLGTKYPWPGYIGSHYGRTRYNGGCVRDGQWYEGVEYLLPKVCEGFEIIQVPTWGCWRIVKS